MQLKFSQALAGMRQAQQFCDANDPALGGLIARGARAGFDSATTRLAGLAEAQEAHRIQASGELANERRLASDLRRKHLWPVVRVARTRVPAAAQLSAVSLPPTHSNGTAIAIRARAMLVAVTPYRQLFHDAGLPADFAEQMDAAITAIETAVGLKHEHQRQRVGSTANILNEVTDARLEVGALDAHVKAALPAGSELLPEWQRIVRTIRSALRQTSKAAADSAADSAAPATPAPAAPAAPAAQAA